LWRVGVCSRQPELATRRTESGDSGDQNWRLGGLWRATLPQQVLGMIG
jgi:hypothetical protein